jgi:hypothetical protein
VRTSTHPVRSRTQSQGVVRCRFVFTRGGLNSRIQNPTYSPLSTHLPRWEPINDSRSARDHDRDRKLLVRTTGLGHRLARRGALGGEHGLPGGHRPEFGGVGVGASRPAPDLG